MQTYLYHLTPLTALGSPLHGDALFGQLCWAIIRRFGETRLNTLLQGYTSGRPFMVVSDALPCGYFPRPQLPSSYFEELKDENLKDIKKRIWLEQADFDKAIQFWPKSSWPKLNETKCDNNLKPSQQHSQPHNSINRLTGTTGEDGFAPYSSQQIWFSAEQKLSLYIVLDENKLKQAELNTCLNDISQLGFGRDASIGLGKFFIDQGQKTDLPSQNNANAYLTLAASAPQANDWEVTKCFYQVMTRFGRHGDVAAVSGQPYKNPLLLAKIGSVFTPQHYQPRLFIGNGLGGLSKVIASTVHQGYAPVLGIKLEVAA